MDGMVLWGFDYWPGMESGIGVRHTGSDSLQPGADARMPERPSLVLELQHDALDPSVKVSDLLRKALVVARKLKVESFETWITKELDGYKLVADIPPYRLLRGSVRAQNPYHGWIPVEFEDKKEAEIASKRHNSDPIAELEAIVARSTPKSVIGMDMPHSFRVQMGLPTALIISVATIAAIIDVVRTTVLQWALKLEEDGILGGGLSFSPREQSAAARHSYNVTNFLGPVTGFQFQQGSNQTMQTIHNTGPDLSAVAAFIRAIRTDLDRLQLAPEVKAEVIAEVTTVESQLQSRKPKTGIIRESLTSLRRVLESVTGTIAAKLLQQALGLTPP